MDGNTEEVSEQSTGTQRQWIVTLLLFSCIAAGILHYKAEPINPRMLTASPQLDSLITLTLDEFDLPQNQIRVSSVQIDSLFSRNVYRVRVEPGFSKTSLHYSLNQRMRPYRVDTVARVHFPDRDMHIHLLANDNIRRSVILTTDRTLRP